MSRAVYLWGRTKPINKHPCDTRNLEPRSTAPSRPVFPCERPIKHMLQEGAVV